MRHEAYIGLGSNIGNREQHLGKAVEYLMNCRDIFVKDCSSIYETQPMGMAEQPLFLNMAAKIITYLGPFELLDVLNDIEARMGRVRDVLWGPRVIDLDLLYFDDKIISTPRLTVPHPRILERAFVMIPLLEMDPHFIHKGAALKDAVKLPEIMEQGVTLFKKRPCI